MNQEIASLLLVDVRREFANQRTLAERALEQLDDEQFFRALDAESNSVAVIVKHIGGNLRSRWTDFLTTDGEKPDRNRDGEFVTAGDTRSALSGVWQAGWAALEHTLSTLPPASLTGHVRIRSEEVHVVQALNRSLAHTAQHVGQIIFLARHWRGDTWQTLSIPRGGSAYFRPPPAS